MDALVVNDVGLREIASGTRTDAEHALLARLAHGQAVRIDSVGLGLVAQGYLTRYGERLEITVPLVAEWYRHHTPQPDAAP